MLDGDVDEMLDLYFRQCSFLVTCRDLAVAAATLANRGRNPVTGERALSSRYVGNVLSVMQTCGMYDFAGEWTYTVGLPAKSGVSGGVIAVLPGQLGIGVLSPPLDARGNSVRGIEVCRRLADDFALHPHRPATVATGVVRRCYRATTVRSARARSVADEAALAVAGRSRRRARAPGRPVLRDHRSARARGARRPRRRRPRDHRRPSHRAGRRRGAPVALVARGVTGGRRPHRVARGLRP